MVFVRPYQASDESAIVHIFRETAHAELQAAGDLALHYASYNWARPYIYLIPQHCLVLDDDNGVAVGYIFGAPDTVNFVKDYKERYLPYLLSQGIKPPVIEESGDAAESTSQGGADKMAQDMQLFTWRPESMLVSKNPSLVQQYPAHLHIDILPAYQGQGWGRILIERTLNLFRSMGVPGVHLGKVGTNFGAAKFYAKLGFDRFSEVMDDGVSGKTGTVVGDGVYLVKAL